MSQTVYIVFLTRSDEERGFALLMPRTTLQAFPHGVYGIDPATRGVLDGQEVRYREATPEEISNSVDGRSVRDPAPAHL